MMIDLELHQSVELEPDDQCEYDSLTELDWAEYQFATIEYDYHIHPDAARSIRAIFEQLHRPNVGNKL